MSTDYEERHRERLLQHARNAASAFQDHDLVSGIVVGGSPSQGGADRESDFDMLVIVKQLPAVETRGAWLTSVTGKHVDPSSLTGTEERKWDEFGGPKDEPEQWMGTGGGLFYFTEDEISRDLSRIAELLVAFTGRNELERPSHIEEYLADLAHGVVLYDAAGFVTECRRQLADYPETARIHLINYHWRRAEIALNEDLRRAVWRADLVHAYDRRVEGTRHLIRMLFAVNRRYFRKAKSLHRLLPSFGACPPRTWERLIEGLRETDPMRGAAILLALAAEMIALIEPPDAIEGRDHWLWVCNRWAEEYGIAERDSR